MPGGWFLTRLAHTTEGMLVPGGHPLPGASADSLGFLLTGTGNSARRHVPTGVLPRVRFEVKIHFELESLEQERILKAKITKTNDGRKTFPQGFGGPSPYS